ncbi:MULTISPECIES: response regulator [Geobacillus]|jgi:two-component system, CitB family, response regulator DctR|uniref:Transcriptional regulatory protein n=2 Tax=Geobacillus thermodenitrificans TaxID=33940 RepID=A4IKM9_GEOTN|nr:MULTISPECIES: response regulator [Geobacillus]ABO65883.1 Two-component response regulator [Geobacillus thermodenitrificans NG80-2]ARA97678.1 two-component system response regulator [Geobacillus thermodenitrificans]ARP41612.1 putative C4-dicarboxylate response regulator DctR [Geobacillus thermodenitrificans]ATO37005.1 two-component system response regulator [Geobacillus thermodenitrificans]KQB94208.1 putative C4-dicarboxylate response regulator DctR [Geobacillus sp. PA-3]
MYRVLLIEDDPMVQEVNRQMIEQVNGFAVVGLAGNGEEGLRLIEELHPDVAVIDIYMPQLDGLETLKEIRARGHEVDILAITAASDIETVRRVLQNGAFDYIVKPFKFERLKQALENYRAFRQSLAEKQSLTQAELDALRQTAERYVDPLPELPKGLNEVTLEKVVTYLRQQCSPVSAEEVAEGVGIARVTARRYLEYLEKSGKVVLDVQYGSIGRPVNRYQLKRI